ncbi:hypothetical protein D3C83_322530 [compost metagenome]
MILALDTELFQFGRQRSCENTGAIEAHLEAVGLLIFPEHVQTDVAAFCRPLNNSIVLQRTFLSIR